MNHSLLRHTLDRETLVARLVEWQLDFLTGENHYGKLMPAAAVGRPDHLALCVMAEAGSDADVYELSRCVGKLAHSWALMSATVFSASRKPSGQGI